MEDELVKSLKSAARRGALISVAATSALALASCSAGQITQTSSQVPAVDGAFSAYQGVQLRDVTVHVNEEGQAGVKFFAANLDTADRSYDLRGITVDGTPVTLSEPVTLDKGCVVMGGLPEEMDLLTEPEGQCYQLVDATLENTGLAFGGNVPVVFDFGSGEVTVNSTVSMPVAPSGENDRVIGEGAGEGH
ncbi:hypothetical protein [Corynebacterium kozikiae]|uniref:hypothetical protein n=1 Tax=Corynebacterium kozikiae TaxID=2968469 RepID=UPI00211C68E3|nr:hypothetical protein [Corynebacterium sp. 76QC2CO]MCQ9343634.1 hypothetical protein [Corynebacterium sp. 76QC2CO]